MIQCKTAPLTEGEVTAAERAAVARLASALPQWSQVVGPGVDSIIISLQCLARSLLLRSTIAERFATDVLASRIAVAIELSEVDAPDGDSWAEERIAREAILADPEDAATLGYADALALERLSGAFAGWYERAGMTGFAVLLAQFCENFVESIELDLLDPNWDGSTPSPFWLTCWAYRLRTADLRQLLVQEPA